MIRASCLCGDVAWEMDGPLELLHHCHCSMCRKYHGTAFATWGAVHEARFRWQRGTGSVRRYESSPGFHRAFCRRCGTVVPEGVHGDCVFTPLGPPDDEPGALPGAHIFVASKAPWYTITDELPQHAEAPA